MHNAIINSLTSTSGWAFFRMVVCICIIAQGCKTREKTNIYPHYTWPTSCEKTLSSTFRHPVIKADNYKSVQDRTDDKQDPNLALALTVSGGGQRAANFGIGVLLGLEEVASKHPEGNLLREVDYFSTVSGGGMAIGAYLSSLRTHLLFSDQSRDEYSLAACLKFSHDLDKKCSSSNVLEFYATTSTNSPDTYCDPCLLRNLERGYLGNILGAVKKPRIWFSDIDRGDLLEKAFAEEMLGRTWFEHMSTKTDVNCTNVDFTLGDMFIADGNPKQPELPMWVCNATVFENGALFPFTPDILAQYKIVAYTHMLNKTVCKEFDPTSLCEFYAGFPVSVGMAASGTFPVFISAQTLVSGSDPSNPYLHLLDGGLADNLGVVSALDLLRQDKAEGKKAMIVVDAYPGEFAPYSKSETSPGITSVLKIASMPLDGWRGRYRHLLQSKAENSPAIIDISFDDLYFDDSCMQAGERIAKSKELFETLKKFGFDPLISYETHSIVRKEKEEKVLALMEKHTPWELLRGVGTSYNIEPWEQSLLIAAGKYIVSFKKEDILNAIQYTVKIPENTEVR